MQLIWVSPALQLCITGRPNQCRHLLFDTQCSEGSHRDSHSDSHNWKSIFHLRADSIQLYQIRPKLRLNLNKLNLRPKFSHAQVWKEGHHRSKQTKFAKMSKADIWNFTLLEDNYSTNLTHFRIDNRFCHSLYKRIFQNDNANSLSLNVNLVILNWTWAKLSLIAFKFSKIYRNWVIIRAEVYFQNGIKVVYEIKENLRFFRLKISLVNTTLHISPVTLKNGWQIKQKIKSFEASKD